jgi:organic radical activating enzyme
MTTINIQPVEKQIADVTHLQVHSVFYTIQGEGPFAGQPAVFVRLAGCNLQCPGCDTDYTSKRDQLFPFEILHLIDMQTCACLHMKAPVPLVVITGGEPFRQPIGPLVRLLVSKGYRVQIETNGTLYAEGLPWDSITVVCSPKTGKLNAKLLPHIDAFKYVMKYGSVDPQDGLPTFALDHTASPKVARPPENNKKPVYLQPMDVQDEAFNRANLNACIESCMKHGYTLQVQIHKIIDME